MDESLTLEKMRALREFAIKNEKKPFVVKTDKQAAEMTKNDPCGREWKKGDEFFVLGGA